MADIQVGNYELRAENIEAMVQGFALQSYIMKDLVMINNSNSWKETFWQEEPEDLTASGTQKVKGIPRNANFPEAEVKWEKVTSVIEKYGLEGTISYEDAFTNEIDVVARTLLRIGRAIAKSVDDEIYEKLTEGGSPDKINHLEIASGEEWNASTEADRNPFKNILEAVKKMIQHNYDPYGQGVTMIVNPHDFVYLMDNEKIQRMFEKEIGNNGRVGRLGGVSLRVSNTVKDNEALMVINQICGTWKSAVPLTTHTEERPGIDWKVRSWELGVTQLTNPKAVTLITNTNADS